MPLRRQNVNFLEHAIEDFEIILDVLAGNRNAFANIVRRYESRVRGYCAVALSSPVLAEDAAQEIFIKAYQALGQFRGNSSFSTWIYRISANHCTDILRKLSRQKNESWEALIEKDGDKIEALLSTPPEAENSDQSELLAKLLDTLPEKSKTILVLREIHGLSYQEMADSLGCTVDAVKARLKRARQELDVKCRHLLKGPASKT